MAMVIKQIDLSMFRAPLIVKHGVFMAPRNDVLDISQDLIFHDLVKIAVNP